MESGAWLLPAALGGFLLLILVANVVAAATEFYRAYRIACGLKTRVRRAGGKDALRLVPLVGGGGDFSLWEVLTGGGGDGGCDGGAGDGGGCGDG